MSAFPGPLGAGSILDVPGVVAGHWTGDGTGVTVVVFPSDTVGSCEVRGGAPATRETALLDPTCTVSQVDAIVLTGGSAFGLATADGVMRVLAEQGRGFPTHAGPVPIVPTAAIFDLVQADGSPPGAEEGIAALHAAQQSHAAGRFPVGLASGRVGAGRGATVSKWRGAEHAQPGGLGSASGREGDAVVGALAVVNAVGDVVAADGTILAGSSASEGVPGFPDPAPFDSEIDAGPLGGPTAGTNTTLVLVATNAGCTKLECHLLAQSAHHGMARAIQPSHTRYDGDIAFAVSSGVVEAQFDRLRALVTEVTAEAIRRAVV
jgi:L-aminopeptidase/D-esterase-like protein